MSPLKENKEQYTRWMKRFEKKIWTKLTHKQKTKLCKRFNLYYTKNDSINTLMDQPNIPMPPLAFTIAAMHKLKIQDRYLLRDHKPYQELWLEKITYDQDKWGAKRIHKKAYGIYSETSLSIEKQLYLEQLLKSSISLEKNNKINVLTATKTLSILQLKMLIKTFENEMHEFIIQQITDYQGNIKKLVKKAEKEWKEIEYNLDYYISGKKNPKLILDKQKNLTPQSICFNIEKTIKGQTDAVKKVATLLYYQQKIYHAHTHKKELPFDPLDPIFISGSTGSGKSFLLETGCDIMGLPYIHIDCSTLVSAGIRGYTTNDIMKDLLRNKTNYKIKEAETAIIIFDELDKLLSHHDGTSILNQLLRVVEGTHISLDKTSGEESEFSKITTISTHKMLFIFSGSFQNLIEEKSKQSGFIQEATQTNNPLSIDEIEKTQLPKELLGRISDIIILNKLNRENYREILLKSKKSPIKRYQKMLAINDKNFELNQTAIDSIIDQAEKGTYGARSLNKAIKQHFEELLYSAPTPQ